MASSAQFLSETALIIHKIAWLEEEAGRQRRNLPFRNKKRLKLGGFLAGSIKGTLQKARRQIERHCHQLKGHCRRSSCVFLVDLALDVLAGIGFQTCTATAAVAATGMWLDRSGEVGANRADHASWKHERYVRERLDSVFAIKMLARLKSESC
jgi:hypothetical protein